MRLDGPISLLRILVSLLGPGDILFGRESGRQRDAKKIEAQNVIKLNPIFHFFGGGERLWPQGGRQSDSRDTMPCENRLSRLIG